MQTIDLIRFMSISFLPVILLGGMMLVLKYLRKKRQKENDYSADTK